jgi:hypothetical protein
MQCQLPLAYAEMESTGTDNNFLLSRKFNDSVQEK